MSRSTGQGWLGVAAAALAIALVMAATVIVCTRLSPASAQEVRPQSEGPIYDLPDGVTGRIVCDRRNREYLLVTTKEGGVSIIPYMDDDGNQAVAGYD